MATPDPQGSWTRGLDPDTVTMFAGALPVPVWVVEADRADAFRCVFNNDAARGFAGGGPGCDLRDTIPPEEAHVVAALRDAAATGSPARVLAVRETPGGGPRVVEAVAVPAPDGRTIVVATWPVGSGPPERGETGLARALDAAPDVIARYDRQHRLVYVNRAAEHILGRARADMIGRTNHELGMPRDLAAVWTAAIEDVLGGAPVHELDFALDVGHGERTFHARLAPDRDENGRAASVVASIRDVTDERRRADALVHLAMHDPVTRLPNRRLLVERLEPALARARRRGRSVALLFIDLDRFKVVNDTYGHLAGDDVLRAVAGRIQTASRAGDTVASFGGDEFVVLCEDVEHAAAAEHIGHRIEAAMRRPFEITVGPTGTTSVEVGASIGIAVSDRGRTTGGALLADADRKMYASKLRRRLPEAPIGPKAASSPNFDVLGAPTGRSRG